ncbi:enoyl-CoA hydratase/isomerase family protein [Devosia naphthalenivorans]|uniref:enoyl-CoA hydratase/isomerase family protein n=1 Tax=Devosia naphthalenivorans TaxID=2082392 RepID=UPI0013B065CA|nr:enoyl-CoA hydratase-related protein [Devosia naphthalenivorans]
MPVLFEKQRNVGIITLSRPESRNAWGQDYTEELPKIFNEWSKDPEVRCVVITGDEQGRAFSAGADMKNPSTHTERTPADFINTLDAPRSAVTASPEQFPKPVIAAVNGYAVGNACILSFSCDLVVASQQAEWRLPQVSLGILPAFGGSLRLARIVGKGNAMRAALGFSLEAEEAFRIGLAQWLVAHDSLMDRAIEVAEKVAQLPPLAVRLVKESLNRGLDAGTLANAALGDVYRASVLERSEDTKETHRAWREKRSPILLGK